MTENIYIAMVDVSNFFGSFNIVDYLNAHERLHDLLQLRQRFWDGHLKNRELEDLLQEMDAFQEVRRRVRADVNTRFKRLVNYRFPEADEHSIHVVIVEDGGRGYDIDRLRKAALFSKMDSFVSQGLITQEELDRWRAEIAAKKANPPGQPITMETAATETAPVERQPLVEGEAAEPGSEYQPDTEPEPEAQFLDMHRKDRRDESFIKKISSAHHDIAKKALEAAVADVNAMSGPSISRINGIKVADVKADEAMFALARRFSMLQPAPAGVILSDDKDCIGVWSFGCKTCPVSPLYLEGEKHK